MDDYLKRNLAYWDREYHAPNVESCVFRMYGQVLKDLLPKINTTRTVLDFGCGEGAALEFFRSKGFDIFGVDISEHAITSCRARMPGQHPNFKLIDSTPQSGDLFGELEVDLVIAIQSLYYLSDKHLEKRMKIIYDSLKPGGIFYATMMGTQCFFYEHSKATGNGMRKVSLDGRVFMRDYFVNFTTSRENLLNKFHMFEPVQVGYYDFIFREDEGSMFHWTFVGRKA